jgi:hypothetical protein
VATKYTKHAKEMLILRAISKKLSDETVKNPDEITDTRDDKKIYLKNFGKNYLKLVVAEEAGNKVIITVHWLAKKRAKS